MRLKLKADPSFKAKVPIPIPGAKDPASVEFTFKHRRRDELKEFMEEAKAGNDIDMIMGCATGWDLEDQFSRESVDELLANYHGAARAIAETYYRELMALRLGN